MLLRLPFSLKKRSSRALGRDLARLASLCVGKESQFAWQYQPSVTLLRYDNANKTSLTRCGPPYSPV